MRRDARKPVIGQRGGFSLTFWISIDIAQISDNLVRIEPFQ
jgi:hypothetical protein